MGKLPVLKAREVIAALQKVGFEVDHVTGSHYILCFVAGCTESYTALYPAADLLPG